MKKFSALIMVLCLVFLTFALTAGGEKSSKDATIEITVADGYIRDYKVSFVCEITAGSDKVTYDATRFVEFISCDKDVKVEAPENLEEYYELDWG